MAITISGSGITSANIADGTITSADFASGVGGKVLQVLLIEDTTAQTVATDTGNGAATGLSITITPSTTSSKILVFWNMQYEMPGTTRGLGMLLMKGSTNIWQSGYTWVDVGQNGAGKFRGSWQHLDSPATTSAVTYTVNAKTEAANAVNLNTNDNKSQMTVMEIGV